jgi:RecA-family ATPase
MMSLREIARALGGDVVGNQVQAPGPDHSPKDRSLSIKLDTRAPDGFVVFTHSPRDDPILCKDYVRDRLGLPPFDGKTTNGSGKGKIVATYDYHDETGELLFQVVRFEPKDFRQRRPDGNEDWVWKMGDTRRVPYHLPELIEAVANAQPIFVCEGEKAVDAVIRLGVPATCSPGGAGKWRNEFSKHFDRANVIMLPDNDEPGRQHADQVATSLRGIAASVKVLTLPGLQEKGDPFDWITAGGTVEQLWALVEIAPNPEQSKSEPAEKADTLRDHPVCALETFCAAELEGVQIEKRQWLVDNVIPFENVSLLSGDGGLGKTILALMLGTALSSRTKWLGMDAMQGASLYFGAEDDKRELHRRLDQIRRELNLSWGDLADLHAISRAGDDALLGTFNRATLGINPTDLCARLERRLQELGAIALFVDTSADTFGGDEINRQQVRQFVGMLRGIAIRNHVAVVLLAHPSVAGIQSGSGTSGSTAWSNSVRSRLYLKAGDTDADERFLDFMKSNYGAKLTPMRLRWQNGIFVPDTAERSAAARANAEAIFLQLLDAYAREDRAVGSKASITYAPAVFASDKRSMGIRKEALKDAMNSLFHKGEIANETFGPPSHQRQRIVRAKVAQ